MDEENINAGSPDTPSLVTFNQVTGFREAVTFIGLSCESEDSVVHLETFVNEAADGVVYLRLTTDKGVTALADSTLKSKCLDHDAFVRLHDFYIACDKGVKDGLLSLWVDDKNLYIGSSFNEQLACFESEVALPLQTGFAHSDDEFDADETLCFEQMMIASVQDTCYDFDTVEFVRVDGVVSMRTGNDRVCIATLPFNVKTLGLPEGEHGPDFVASIPTNVFRLISMVSVDPNCNVEFDWKRKKLRVFGGTLGIEYGYGPGKLTTGTTDGMTTYMKFDTIGMMATIDMVYGLNHKDPIAPVELHPLDEHTVELIYGYPGRYEGVITMSGVRMMDLNKNIKLPMDVSTMMVSHSGAAVLELLQSDDGRLFMAFTDKKFARKCMYFGEQAAD